LTVAKRGWINGVPAKCTSIAFQHILTKQFDTCYGGFMCILLEPHLSNPVWQPMILWRGPPPTEMQCMDTTLKPQGEIHDQALNLSPKCSQHRLSCEEANEQERDDPGILSHSGVCEEISSGEEDTREDRLAEHQIRRWRAAYAAGLRGKGPAWKGGFLHRYQHGCLIAETPWFADKSGQH